MFSQVIDPLQPYFVINADSYYKMFLPDSPIAHFYRFTCKEKISLQNGAVPDGAVDIIFDCDPQIPSAFVAGTVEQAGSNVFSQNHTYFGVRFLPGILDHFGEASAGELVGKTVDFAEVTGMTGLEEEICAASSFRDQIELFLSAFSGITDQKDSSGILSRMLFEIYQSGGNIRVQELEEKLNYSRRHLLRSFKDSVGLDIKTFCRIIRFQTSLSRISRGDFASMAEVAVEGGYYDQNHLQRDFREFASLSPGNYCRLLRDMDYRNRITLV